MWNNWPCYLLNEVVWMRERVPHFTFVLAILVSLEILPYPSFAIALREAIPVPPLVSTEELALEVGVTEGQAQSLFCCAVVQMR